MTNTKQGHSEKKDNDFLSIKIESTGAENIPSWKEHY